MTAGAFWNSIKMKDIYISQLWPYFVVFLLDNATMYRY